MATIVYVNSGNQNGGKVMSALAQINSGFSGLESIDGLRANSISAGADVMAQNFGVPDLAQAQALSDRMAGIIAWWNAETTWISTAAEARGALKDLLDAVTIAP